MKEDPIIYDLKHVDEHVSCVNYRLNMTSGFKYLNVNKGYILQEPSVSQNYIIILLTGDYQFTCDKFCDKKFKGGEMVCIPRGCDFIGRVMSDGEAIIFGFDQPESSCDKQVFSQYVSYCSDDDYSMEPTPIRYPMTEFLHLLGYYLRNRMNCVHLHSMKHKEFFLILRAFYTKEETARFLWPVLSRMSEFKYFIKTNYRKVQGVSGLIEMSQYSRSVFFRKFKDEFGDISPAQWIRKQQKLEILELAAIPNMTVKDMMNKMGFSAMNSFQRLCDELFGQTAGEILSNTASNKAVGTTE